MKKFLQKKLKNEKGMTLIELLAVIVIIAIIAAIAIPAIGNIIENSRVDGVKSDALNVLNAAKLYEAQEGDIPAAGISVFTLVDEGFLEDAGTIPAASASSGTVLPGPALSATVVDVVSTGDIIFSSATIQDINDSDSASAIRQTLDTPADYTITP